MLKKSMRKNTAKKEIGLGAEEGLES